MSKDRAHRVQELFHAALEVPLEERENWLDAQCCDDEALLLEVRSLLHHDRRDHDPLENGLQGLRSGAELVGQLRRGLQAHCPHCHHPVDFGDVDDSRELLCDTCGGGLGREALRDTKTFAASPAMTIDKLNPQDPEIIGESGAIPDRIGEYQILNLIAVHGQGVVYRANHPHLNRQAVIKVSINPLDEQSKTTALAEGRALASLSHPNLAQVYDLFLQEDCPYLVMEYIEGRNLAEQLRAASLSASEAASLTVTLAQAIQHAHDHGVIHRDLKPANVVMRAADGQPKIIDFGLAQNRSAYSDQDLENSYGGTIAYMAPEQAKQVLDGPFSPTATDERIDVFALGAILYEMLTGKRLYQFKSQREGLDQAVDCAFDQSLLDAPGIPTNLRDACLQALAKEPGERFRSAAELADAVTLKKKPRRFIPLLALCIVALLAFFAIVFRQSLFGNGKNVDSVSKPMSPTNVVEDTRIGDEILSGVQFIHIANSESAGFPGLLFRNGPVCEGDDLRIEIRFEEPAYCFLFAINPDGAVQLCYPDDPELVQDAPVPSVSYPRDAKQGFAFTDGVGQQAFLIVESRQALGSFHDWQLAIASLSEPVGQTLGQWMWSQGQLKPIIEHQSRGAPRDLKGGQPFAALLNEVSAANPTLDIRAVSFPVVPR